MRVADAGHVQIVLSIQTWTRAGRDGRAAWRHLQPRIGASFPDPRARGVLLVVRNLPEPVRVVEAQPS